MQGPSLPEAFGALIVCTAECMHCLCCSQGYGMEPCDHVPGLRIDLQTAALGNDDYAVLHENALYKTRPLEINDRSNLQQCEHSLDCTAQGEVLIVVDVIKLKKC